MTTPAAADPVQEKEEEIPPVPLECMLCPKKSVFSDASHLLTHISSKSHLHQKFSIEFKSKSDPAAKEMLERYEAWYAEHRIERLMSERLAARGTRKPTKRNRAAASKPMRKSTSALDALRAEQITAHLAGSAQTPENLPRLAYWNTAPPRVGTEYNSSFYHSPLAMRQRSAYPHPDDVGAGSYVLKHSPYMHDLNGSNMTGHPSDIDSSFGAGFLTEEDAQSSRLKGVIWPGMDLFDSATPDQKKMRNQRKGTSIVDHLKLTSQAISAIETVWGPEGEVRKERDIYASPSDDGSPQSTPPPRKRKQRTRDAPSSSATPLSIMKCEDGRDSQPTTKHTGRLNGNDPPHRWQTRSSSRAAAKNSMQQKTAEVDHDETDVEDSSYSLATSRPKGPFDVYFEGGTANTIDTQTGPEATRDNNGLDPVALSNRPALQQLDPNLSISDSSAYFKPSTSTRYYDHGNDSGHMAFRSQASPYGTFPGIAGNSLSSMPSQSRSSSIYPPFDHQMFGGMGGAEASSVPYNGSAGRRMGFGSFGMDPNSSPFGYSDQREGSIRDPNFADPTFPSTPRLFEL